jgi:hypothetical protein
MAGHDAWWVVHSHVLQDMLKRAHQGEDPELLYVELIANSEDHQDHDDEDGG